jgi:hypothetical protein
MHDFQENVRLTPYLVSVKIEFTFFIFPLGTLSFRHNYMSRDIFKNRFISE